MSNVNKLYLPNLLVEDGCRWRDKTNDFMHSFWHWNIMVGKIFKNRLFISIKRLFSSCFFHELFTGFEFVVNLLLLDLNTNERQHIVRTHQQGLDGLSNYGENFQEKILLLFEFILNLWIWVHTYVTILSTSRLVKAWRLAAFFKLWTFY